MIKPPEHIAIIMDGNGRWAKNKEKRFAGHIRGAETVSEIVEEVARKNKFSYPFCIFS